MLKSSLTLLVLCVVAVYCNKYQPYKPPPPPPDLPCPPKASYPPPCWDVCSIDFALYLPVCCEEYDGAEKKETLYWNECHQKAKCCADDKDHKHCVPSVTQTIYIGHCCKEQQCTYESTPMCGSDGKVYQGPCDLSNADCRDRRAGGKGVTPAGSPPCKKPEAPEIDSPEDPDLPSPEDPTVPPPEDPKVTPPEDPKVPDAPYK